MTVDVLTNVNIITVSSEEITVVNISETTFYLNNLN